MSVSPLRPKGPPLNALRAFEAAARTGSFKTAAEELGVTAGAVSQHVKTLETWAGVTLFHRNPQGVILTRAGRDVLPELTRAFDTLASVSQSLRTLSPNPDVHIATLPCIAQLWLPSRLGPMRAARPDLDFSVTALETPPRFAGDFFDLAIFFAVPDGSPDQIVLAEDIIFPVCAPHRLETAQGLPLLHDQTWLDDWTTWSRATGTVIADPTRGPRYSLYSLAVEEAKSGAGALMGHACLIERALADGTLCPMSGKTCSTGRSLVLNLPHASRRHPDTDTLVERLTDALDGSGQGPLSYRK